MIYNGHTILNSDIEGVERWVIGFSKEPNEIGEHTIEVEYKLKGISLDKLREIFNIDMSSKQQIILDMVTPLDIDSKQAILLNPFVQGGQIDVSKYFFELHCYQAPGYSWSEGYAQKIED